MQRVRTLIHRFRTHSLMRNSFFLMLSSIVVAGVGFLFWVVVARSFSTEAVGLATTLLSASSLISLFGLGGFDTVFVRFLARASDKSKMINTGLLVSALLSAAIALAFALLTPLIAPDMSFVHSNLLYLLLFVMFTVFTTWNTTLNAVFIAHRKGQYVLIANIIFSAVKLGLPFMVTSNDPMLIFSIVGIAQAVYVCAGLWIAVRKLGYRPRLQMSRSVIRDTYRYGTATYASNLFNLLPDFVLPILVLNMLGAHSAAYFYIAFTIANFLYTAIFTTTQATLAEASHDEEAYAAHLRRGVSIVAALLVPGIIGVLLLAPYVLAIFGSDYRENAVALINILTVSSVAVALYSILGTYFKATHQLKAIMTMTGVNSAAIVILALVLTQPFGLAGVGWAWLLGSVASVITGGLFVIANQRRQA